MRYLIPTYPSDIHAVEVALVLEHRGHEAVLWLGSDFPTVQSASVELGGTAVDWELAGPGLDGARPPFDGVWFRRPTPPVLPESLHPGDLPVARRECNEFIAGLYLLAAPDAFWVNPPPVRRAELKPMQLREAARAGLEIPRTLMSNDPGRIRRFLQEYRGRSVYKPFFPAQWDQDQDGRIALLLTNEVELDDLPSDETLRLTPGIFQEKIEKAYELRVTILGEHVVTARLLSQESEATRLDWRAGAGKIRVEPGRLPEEVERACLRLMRKLGIFFGCFDFIVTPEGKHVFLEVNPAGQFLWVEEACPDLPLLAPFVDFLLARRPDFRWTPSPGFVRHADWRPPAATRIEELVARHVAPANVYVSSDEEEGEAQ